MNTTPTTIVAGPRSLATILAALRRYQRGLAENDNLLPADVADIATNGDTLEPMTAEEIDGLCETLNCGE